MKMVFKVLGTAALGVMAMSGSQASAAAFQNGSFEFGTNPGSFTTLAAGSTAITGWVVGSGVGGIDYIGSYWKASDGNRSLDLAGNGRGSISQTFTTTPGQLYRVTFDYAGNPDQKSVKALNVFVNSDDADDFFFTNTALTTKTNMGWTTGVYEFMATNTASTLTFAAATPRTSPYGPALDNVTVSAVPEATTWAMMVLGFGMVGFGLRSRRRVSNKVSFA